MPEIRLFLSQMRRVFVNPSFWVATMIFVAALFVNSMVELNEYATVTIIVEKAELTAQVLVIGVLPCAAFALSFSREREEGALQFYYMRVGVPGYVFIKYVAVILSGFFVVFTGYFVFTCLLALAYPFSSGLATLTSCYSSLLEGGHYIGYVLCFAVNFSLSGSIFAGLAMWMSMYLKEKYAPVVLPYVIYMMLQFVSQIAGVPPGLLPSSWMLTYFDLGTPMFSIAMKLAVTCAVHAAGVLASISQAERSVRNA